MSAGNGPLNSPRDAVLVPAACVLATVLASTALTAVIEGASWLGYILIAALLVAATGVTLRALRVPTALVGPGQLIALLFLVVGSFTDSGIAGIIPGPAALNELNTLLNAAFEQIRMGLPPVPATPGLLCVTTIAMGLVAVLVDALAVTAKAPAVTGLILLCVYAVPASLSDGLLPWWTFLLGAGAFAVLLAVDGDHRHRSWRTREVPTPTSRSGALATPVATVGAAVVVGLVVGSSVTAVGTIGRLPGSDKSGTDSVASGLGIEPFTALRGMLNRSEPIPMFRVRGMASEPRLLRVFTLSRYVPDKGWTLPKGPMPSGVPATRQPLPAANLTPSESSTTKITINPLNWTDVWLPIYGTPRVLRDIAEGWFYDPVSGAVFREKSTSPDSYVEFADITQPSAQQLRSASPEPGEISDVYTRLSYIDPRVARLAERLTQDAESRFGKVRAVLEYFEPSNGFTYDTETAPPSDANALADFVLFSKRGYCEQYASSMAVMLRSLGIPTRVAVGFTAGYRDGKVRVITTRDAHAWVEVYFSDIGWVSFDPTPAAGGRGFLPSYLEGGDGTGPDTEDSETQQQQGSQQPSRSARNKLEKLSGPGQVAGSTTSGFPERAPNWAGFVTIGLLLLAIVATLALVLVLRRANAVPGRGVSLSRHLALSGLARWLPLATAAIWLIVLLFAGWQVHWALAVVLAVLGVGALAPPMARELIRRRRLHAVTVGGADAAQAAWDELLDECHDRDLAIAPGDTLRSSADKIVERNRLDADGSTALGSVVGIMERRWYAPAVPPDAGPGSSEPDSELPGAFARLRYSLTTNAPLSLRGRLFPLSILRRRRQ